MHGQSATPPRLSSGYNQGGFNNGGRPSGGYPGQAQAQGGFMGGQSYSGQSEMDRLEAHFSSMRT